MLCFSFYYTGLYVPGGRSSHDRMVQLPVQSVPIITKVVSSNPVHDKLYSIQHYVIKFASNLRQVGGFLHKKN
jgi:hypothetical protein